VTRSFFEFPRPATPRRPRWGIQPPTGRDTCFENIVGDTGPMSHLRTAGGIHQPSWKPSPGSGPAERGRRETPGQGHDRNKCTLQSGRSMMNQRRVVDESSVPHPRRRPRHRRLGRDSRPDGGAHRSPSRAEGRGADHGAPFRQHLAVPRAVAPGSADPDRLLGRGARELAGGRVPPRRRRRSTDWGPALFPLRRAAASERARGR
jgi:hypothetical protein